MAIDLSPAEQWVVHHVMLDSIGLARPQPTPEEPPEWVIEILQKVEGEDHEFTPLELDHIQHECSAYARDTQTPDSDRELATAIAERIDEVLGDENIETTAST